jgi:hypothetical protein
MKTRLLKELRLLALPAGAVVGTAVVALAWVGAGEPGPVTRAWLLRVVTMVFFLGVPLLVALPFGAEFQQRTLVLLLAQPLSRTRLWAEKCAVLTAVVLVVGALQVALARAGLFQDVPPDRAVLYVVLMLGSGVFWTMIAGSAIGGLAFAGGAIWIVELGGNMLIWRVWGLELPLFSVDARMMGLRIAYSLVMVWLGWRAFARYQVRMHGEAIGSPAAGALPAVPWLRCGPRGVLLNLLRKELHLHQAALQIAGVFVLCWAVAAAYFGWAPDPPLAEVVLVGMLTTYVLVSLVLTATISMSEETTLGVRAWHLTLPVSTRTQWAVKLGVSVVMAALLTVGLPLLIVTLSQAVFSLPGQVLQVPRNARFLTLIAAGFVICFWASSMFGHTVRAAVGSGAAIAGLLMLIPAVDSLAKRLRLGSELLTSVMVRNQLSPDALHPAGLTWVRHFETVVMLAVLAAASVLVFRQSLTAFRRVDVGTWKIGTNAVQLAAVVAVMVFIPSQYLSAVTAQYRSAPVRELTEALTDVSRSHVATPRGVPEHVTVPELESTGRLSPETSRWLRGSRIAVRQTMRDTARRYRVYLMAEVTFPNGRTFHTFYTVPQSPQ